MPCRKMIKDAPSSLVPSRGLTRMREAQEVDDIKKIRDVVFLLCVAARLVAKVSKTFN